MVGAGTARLTAASKGQALHAGCPLHAPLANPDNGQPLLACGLDWAPVCTPAGSAASCRLTVRAVAAVPAAPDLAAGEGGGWAFTGWTAGPCSGSRALACAFDLGTCAKGGACAYTGVALAVAFNDTRAPTARIVDRPPAVGTSEGGRVAFSFRSNEYASQEVSTFECRLDQDAWRSCAAPPGTYVIQVDDGPHQLRVRASDPSGNKQQARIVVASWTQRSKPQIVFRTAPGA